MDDKTQEVSWRWSAAKTTLALPADLEPLSKMLLKAFDTYFAPTPGALSVIEEEKRGIMSIITGRGKKK